ncbi:MAG: Fe(2+) transporter FeoB [Chroococcopsis gigantea SAG 12.99]|jgi:ferrous iron transport protein B|nr:ferrous iron transport protein B [Chlorogloea purpurea SAG 13.99]MDV3002209.1 Fe(2+) transporter FeoB [Chroococcopsis gigantea SAG 12.99]
MTCHAGATVAAKNNAVKRVALLGMPNTGKSTFFNRMTGATAFVGNWPGVTVDLMQANVKINGETAEFVDLPGIYDLNGFSEDEKVVQRFLQTFPVDLMLVIINASQIDRQIRLPLQIKALGLPAVVMLNMADEAKRYGIHITPEILSERLGMPVCLLSAKYGKGYTNAYLTIAKGLAAQLQSCIVGNTKEYLELEGQVTPSAIQSLLTGAVVMPSQLRKNITTTIDRILLHPIFGLPIFFAGMFVLFWFVWNLGLPSQDIADKVTGWLQSNVIEPLVSPLPTVVQDFILSGLWGGVATVASFVPLILLFFIMMAILEDSGYLSRSAYLMDALMSRLGLDGRSFVLQMMGFGCNVPALMGTRVMRSKALRLLTMLIIPFALCSARLQVFVFIIAAVFPNGNGAIVLFSLYILSFVIALLTAALFKGVFKNEEPFVLELPPYRFPTMRQIFLRAWGEVTHFLRRASKFIILGCVAVWFLTNLPPGATGLDTWGGKLGSLFSPIMQPIGIDTHLTLALIFGFIAKEVVIGSLAVIYGVNGDAVGGAIASSVTFIQGYSFCIFCLLYTPCLTTIATMYKESKSWKYTGFALLLSFVIAWVSSFIFYQGASLLTR